MWTCRTTVHFITLHQSISDEIRLTLVCSISGCWWWWVWTCICRSSSTLCLLAVVFRKCSRAVVLVLNAVLPILAIRCWLPLRWRDFWIFWWTAGSFANTVFNKAVKLGSYLWKTEPFEDAPFINNDTITCYQWTRLPVGCSKQVFWTFSHFPILSSPLAELIWEVLPTSTSE